MSGRKVQTPHANRQRRSSTIASWIAPLVIKWTGRSASLDRDRTSQWETIVNKPRARPPTPRLGLMPDRLTIGGFALLRITRMTGKAGTRLTGGWSGSIQPSNGWLATRWLNVSQWSTIRSWWSPTMIVNASRSYWMPRATERLGSLSTFAAYTETASCDGCHSRGSRCTKTVVAIWAFAPASAT